MPTRPTPKAVQIALREVNRGRNIPPTAEKILVRGISAGRFDKVRTRMPTIANRVMDRLRVLRAQRPRQRTLIKKPQRRRLP